MSSLDFLGRKLKSRFCEKYYPYFIAVLYLILIFLPCVRAILVSYISKALNMFNYRDLISQIMTVQSILFGFLLTVLAITIQGNTESISYIKKSGRFNELISFNKQAIYSSLISVFVSLALYLLPTKEPSSTSLLLWFGLTMLSFLLALRYIRIFFLIIKE